MRDYDWVYRDWGIATQSEKEREQVRARGCTQVVVLTLGIWTPPLK